MMKPGVVVVSWNSAQVISACLHSCAGAEVVVVDNASSDGTPEVVARLGARLIANPENRGFAAAVNQGVSALDSPYVLLLNPDARMEAGLDALVACCAPSGVGAACGKLLDESGAPQAGFNVRRLPGPLTLAFEVLGLNRLWPSNPVNRRYRCLDFDPEHEADVEQPAGAFLMLKREVWRELGGFDERFHPLWFEDVDYAARLRRAGYRIRYTPRAAARHQGGHSLAALPWDLKISHWYANLLSYGQKHFGWMGRGVVSLAVTLSALPRAVMGVFGRGGRMAIPVYARVVGLALRRLVPARRGGMGGWG